MYTTTYRLSAQRSLSRERDLAPIFPSPTKLTLIFDYVIGN